jgi:hypothetical protein
MEEYKMTHFFRPAATFAVKADHAPQFLRPLTWHIAAILLLSICFFTSCQKQLNNSSGEEQLSTNKASHPSEDVLSSYTGLQAQTLWELQQARAATARYRNIDNAIRDGYTNIGVDVENMGHHYMRTDIVDGTFDIRQPEILVYNGKEDGTQELVAVEYAVPLTFPKPEGFTGSADVWNGTSGFPLWLVHAWVWDYNPDGVFNWTNPLVDLH